ncbi:hypothetical protein K1T71_014583 [Dendrolimus kikuchii]|uniref:Uncharacterized protein n=1 Tax=Dendrolimus kikuchii TaxID=765133 RepID=A0ACC1CEN9_9NEOP|nr:hypothetical protein K1T71_014583 [Dendrolimus kikuchii]
MEIDPSTQTGDDDGFQVVTNRKAKKRLLNSSPQGHIDKEPKQAKTKATSQPPCIRSAVTERSSVLLAMASNEDDDALAFSNRTSGRTSAMSCAASGTVGGVTEESDSNVSVTALTALCNGDSGGGLVFPATEHTGITRYYLRGIVSTAPKNQAACNAFTITTFTEILKHEFFIREGTFM